MEEDDDSVEKVHTNMKSRPTFLLGMGKVLAGTLVLFMLAGLGMVTQTAHPAQASRVDKSPNAPITAPRQSTTTNTPPQTVTNTPPQTATNTPPQSTGTTDTPPQTTNTPPQTVTNTPP